MKISYKGDYAIKAMLLLAVNYGSSLVSSHDLAERIDAPMKFLEQVMMELRRGGFVESRRGREGGYMLSRAPSKISIGDVVRYIDGPIEPIACVDERYSECKDIDTCVLKELWTRIHRVTSDIVDNVTFQDLATKVNRKKQVLTYVI